MGVFEGRWLDQEPPRSVAVASALRPVVVNDEAFTPPSVAGGEAEPVQIGLDDGSRCLTIVEESLAITRAEVDRGGYRITKRVEMHDQLVDELLRSEGVQIERRVVNNPVLGDNVPGIRQEGDTLIVPVIEEMLVTVKRLVVVEEVWITRTHSTRREPQSYTLRREHIDVERLVAEQPSAVKAS